MDNDCKLGAVAERWQGVGQDADDLVFPLAGMRTGAGLILDGTLRLGYGAGSSPLLSTGPSVPVAPRRG